MPTPQLQALIDKSPRKVSISKAEKYWSEAEKIANKAVEKNKFKKDSSQYWAYVVAIVKNRLGYSKKNPYPKKQAASIYHKIVAYFKGN